MNVKGTVLYQSLRNLAIRMGYTTVGQRKIAAAESQRAHAAPTQATPQQGPAPLLSIIVPIYNVEKYLNACLKCLENQDLQSIEVILIDDGSTDTSAAIAQRYAAKHAHFYYHRQVNTGLAGARNAGVSKARGKYIAFLDSDDMVYRNTYKLMVDTLEASGSDFVASSYNRYSRGSDVPAGRWIQQAHDQAKVGTTLAESPEILVSQVAWNKVFRRSFWDATQLKFPVGKLYEDQPVSTRAFALSRGFDILPNRLFRWRIRDEGASITQESHTLPNLQHQIGAWDDSLEILQEISPLAADERRRMLLSNDIPRLLLQSENSDDAGAYLSTIRAAAQRYVDRVADGTALRDVRVQHKIAYEYLFEGGTTSLQAYIKSTRFNFNEIPILGSSTEPPHADLDSFLAALELPVTHDNTLGQTQFLPVFTVRSWVPREDFFEVEGWAFITNHDATIYPRRLTIEAVNLDTGARHALETVDRYAAEANLGSGSAFCDYRSAGYTARLPYAALSNHGRWVIEATIAQGDQEETVAARKLRGGIASHLPSVVNDEARIDVAYDAFLGITMTVASRHPYRVSVLESDEVLAFRLPDGGPWEKAQIIFTDANAGEKVVVSPTRQGDEWLAIVPDDLPENDSFTGARDIEIRYKLQDAGAKPFELVSSSSAIVGSRQIRATRRLNAKVVEYQNTAIVRSVAISDGKLWLEFDHIASRLSPSIVFNLSSNKVNLDGAVHFSSHQEAGSRLTIAIDISTAQWRTGAKTLPLGKYSITGRTPHGPIHFKPHKSLISSIPVLYQDEFTRAWVDVSAQRVAINVESPVAPETLSAHGQRVLKDEYRTSTAPIEPNSYLMRTYYGETATCNALALSEFVLANVPESTVYWAVKDYSVPVPSGSIPVIVNSEEWYQAFAIAQVYVDNVHQPDYSNKRPGQVYVQTMHGYPFKLMGHGYWTKARYPHSRIESFDRRALEWDLFVSPAAYASPLLAKEFKYPHAMLEIGYPRNDIYFEERGQDIREQTRKRLGVRAAQTVVLYAPTWRDGVSTSEFKSERVDFVDYQDVARELGDDYVLLVRGHQMSARVENRLGSAGQVIDVTDYPEIRDLILASDMAVLDYSSLRFDYVLTGRPMVYLVPDLATYVADRGWLFDYEPTTAGPQAINHESLVDSLRTGDLATTERDTLQANLMELEDGQATQRLFDAIKERLRELDGANTSTDSGHERC